MPKLKLKVESAIGRYLTEEITDEDFKERIQSILDEFEGKNLLHQNIGQITWRIGKDDPRKKNRFEKIWTLLEQVSPRIIEDFNLRMKKCKT